MTGQDRHRRFRLCFLYIQFLFVFALLSASRAYGVSEDTGNSGHQYLFKGDEDNPPFEFMENGQATGMNVELLKGVALETGLNIRIELGPGEQVLEEFKSGKIDGLTGLHQTRESKSFSNFTFPSVISSYALFVRRDSYEQNFTDGWNGSIAVKNRDLAHDYLIKTGFKGTIFKLQSTEAILHCLAEGHCDGALLPHYQGIYLRNRLRLDNITLGEESVFPWAYGFAVASGNDELWERLNEGLYKYVASGKYLNIWIRWFEETLPLKPAPYLPFLYTALIVVFILLLLLTSWTYFLRSEVNRRTKSLRESEERYRTLFENSNDALFLMQEKVIDCNRQACELMGCAREALLNTPPLDFSPPFQPDGSESHSLSRQIMETALKGIPQVFPWVHLRSDGSPIYTEISMRMVPGLGKPTCMSAVRDLSPRIRAEQAARRQQDLVSGITVTSPIGIIVLDASGTIIFANASAERILGLERAMVCGRTYNDPLWKISSVGGGYFPEQDRPFSLVMRTGKPVYDIIYAINHADGRRTVLSVSAAPLLNDAGIPDGVVAAFEDISERIKEEAERTARWKRLERQQAALIHIAKYMSPDEEDFSDILRLIVSSAADVLNVSFSAMWLLDDDQIHLRCIVSSLETLEPVPESAVLDVRTCPEYMEALEAGRHVDAADAQHDPRTIHLLESYLIPNDVGALLDAPIRLNGKLVGVLCNEHHGETRDWHADELRFAADLADQAAQSIAFREHFRTENERRMLSDRMQQAQRFESLGILAGGVAHDFNNLLTAILGNVDLALMDIPHSNPAETAMNEIKVLSNQAAQLCLSLLTYAGKGRSTPMLLDLNEEIRRTSYMMTSLIKKHVRLVYNLSENTTEVIADSGQFQQVIMNLVLNASEAIQGNEGTITIRTCLMQCDNAYFRRSYFSNIPGEGLYAAIEVSDTGVGIDEEILSKIFNPFFSTKFVGRGLGLCAVLGIVNGHKGCIRIQSKPGKGAIFTVLLPADANISSTSGESGMKTNVHAASPRILLIDGNSISQKVTLRILTRLGYTVIQASSPVDGITLLARENNTIQCVLLDQALDQILVAEQVTELHHACNGIPILLATETETQEAMRLYGHLGFSGFLEKPLLVKMLAARLSAVIEK